LRTMAANSSRAISKTITLTRAKRPRKVIGYPSAESL
jgi:hypothetical protein